MKKNEVIAELKCENMNLQTENQRLQNCYDNICSFKHDFGNIMQAIGGYIEAKDIVGLKEMYSSIIQECQDINDVYNSVYNTVPLLSTCPSIAHFVPG